MLSLSFAVSLFLPFPFCVVDRSDLGNQLLNSKEYKTLHRHVALRSPFLSTLTMSLNLLQALNNLHLGASSPSDVGNNRFKLQGTLPISFGDDDDISAYVYHYMNDRSPVPTTLYILSMPDMIVEYTNRRLSNQTAPEAFGRNGCGVPPSTGTCHESHRRPDSPAV